MKSLTLFSLLPAVLSAGDLCAQWTEEKPATVPIGGNHAVYNSASQTVSMFRMFREPASWDGDNWTIGNSNGPSRGVPAMAFDRANGVVVSFGGISTFSFHNDTQVFDGVSWKQKSPSTTPIARTNQAMVYDENNGVVVMFGGGTKTSALSDTWTWDGTNWTRHFPAHSPSARGGARMVYNSTRKTVLLFGGYTDIDGPNDETWEWDGSDWTQLSPATAPPGRSFHGMAYDPSRDRTVLFGGFSSITLGDTWEFDGTNWVQIGGNGPAPRGNHGMTYDHARGEVLMVGGNGYTGTWTYSGAPVTVAEYEPFASGCAGSMGVPILDAAPGSLPRINSTFTAEVTNLPPASSSAFLVFGFSKTEWSGTPLPLSLGGLGLWNCTLYVSAEAIAPMVVNNGKAQLSISINNDPSIIGLQFFNQAVVGDPGAANPVHLIVSNPTDGTIGS